MMKEEKIVLTNAQIIHLINYKEELEMKHGIEKSNLEKRIDQNIKANAQMQIKKIEMENTINFHDEIVERANAKIAHHIRETEKIKKKNDELDKSIEKIRNENGQIKKENESLDKGIEKTEKEKNKLIKIDHKSEKI